MGKVSRIIPNCPFSPGGDQPCTGSCENAGFLNTVLPVEDEGERLDRETERMASAPRPLGDRRILNEVKSRRRERANRYNARRALRALCDRMPRP